MPLSPAIIYDIERDLRGTLSGTLGLAIAYATGQEGLPKNPAAVIHYNLKLFRWCPESLFEANVVRRDVYVGLHADVAYAYLQMLDFKKALRYYYKCIELSKCYLSHIEAERVLKEEHVRFLIFRIIDMIEGRRQFDPEKMHWPKLND